MFLDVGIAHFRLFKAGLFESSGFVLNEVSKTLKDSLGFSFEVQRLS